MKNRKLGSNLSNGMVEMIWVKQSVLECIFTVFKQAVFLKSRK